METEQRQIDGVMVSAPQVHEEEILMPELMATDSAYSSLVNSQQRVASATSSPKRSQLQSLAEAAQERARENALKDAVVAGHSSMQGGGGRGNVGDGGGGGGFVPINIPAAHHPAHGDAGAAQQLQQLAAGAEMESVRGGGLPCTPKLQTGCMPATSTGMISSAMIMSSTPPTSPGVVAGSKRTCSGAVKASASVPNSPMEGVVSTSVMAVPDSPRVDPSRIQEVCSRELMSWVECSRMANILGRGMISSLLSFALG